MDNPLHLPVLLWGLDTRDLAQLFVQAGELWDEYRDRDRVGVGDVFLGVVNCVSAERQRRAAGDETHVIVDLVVPADPTAPADHVVDDRGTALAWVRHLMEDPATLPLVRGVWEQVSYSIVQRRDER